MTVETHKTFCRFCHAYCAIEVDVEDGRPIAVRGDTEDPVYGGYTCIKGRQLPEQYTTPARVTRSLKRRPDGEFEEIDTDRAMDEIAAKVKQLMGDHGPRSIATYVGSYGYQNSAALVIPKAWHQSIDSPSYYTSVTIDQPAKAISASRFGVWGGGTHKFTDSEVCMMIGNNPVVSQFTPFGGPPPFSPYARLRDEMKKGMKVIVVDPRKTEVANRATLHLQVNPGEDPTLLSGMIRIILDEGLNDRGFCAHNLDDLEELTRRVEPYVPEYVAERCGITVDDLFHRLGIPIELPGGPLDPARRPTKFDALKLIASGSRIDIDVMRDKGKGHIYEEVDVRVQPGREKRDSRLQLLPEGVANEITEVYSENKWRNGKIIDEDQEFSHLLISRRLKHVFNSSGQQLTGLQKKGTTNPAYMHPDDLAALRINSGDLVEIEGAYGMLVGVAEAAKDVKPGVISMAHAWGDIPGNWGKVRQKGSSTNRLIDDHKTYDPITGQPRMTAIPVNVRHIKEDAA